MSPNTESPNTEIESPVASQTDTEAKKQFRGSSLLLAGRFLAVGVNFVFQVLVVRYLTKSDYGAFAYALSLVVLGSSIVRFGMGKPLSRFVPIFKERRDYARMAGAILVVLATILGLGISLVLIVFGLQGVLARNLVSNPLSMALLLTLIFLAPIQALENILEKMFAIFARPRSLFFRRHILGPGLKICAVLPLVVFHGNVYVFAICYLIGGILGTLYSIVVLVGVLRKQGLLRHFTRKTIRLPAGQMFSFGVPLLATDLAFVLRTSFAAFLLEFVHGTASVAAFRAVLPVARLNLLVMESFKLLFSPAAARMFARNDRKGIDELYWKNAAWIALLTFPVFCVSFALARPLTILLFGERYADSGIILTLLSLGCYLNACFGFNALTLQVLGKVRCIVVNDTITSVAAIGLNLFLIPAFGAYGAAVAFCCILILQNILNQISLFRSGAIASFQGSCLKVYSTIVIAAAVLLVVQFSLSPNFLSGLLLASICSGFVLWMNFSVLDIGVTFPELLRIGPVKRVLGLLGDSAKR